MVDFRWNVTLAEEGKYDSLHVSRKTPHKSQVLFLQKLKVFTVKTTSDWNKNWG